MLLKSQDEPTFVSCRGCLTAVIGSFTANNQHKKLVISALQLALKSS